MDQTERGSRDGSAIHSGGQKLTRNKLRVSSTIITRFQ